jgi:hypothetical protein
VARAELIDRITQEISRNESAILSGTNQEGYTRIYGENRGLARVFKWLNGEGFHTHSAEHLEHLRRAHDLKTLTHEAWDTGKVPSFAWDDGMHWNSAQVIAEGYNLRVEVRPSYATGHTETRDLGFDPDVMAADSIREIALWAIRRERDRKQQAERQ